MLVFSPILRTAGSSAVNIRMQFIHVLTTRASSLQRRINKTRRQKSGIKVVRIPARNSPDVLLFAGGLREARVQSVAILHNDHSADFESAVRYLWESRRDSLGTCKFHCADFACCGHLFISATLELHDTSVYHEYSRTCHFAPCDPFRLRLSCLSCLFRLSYFCTSFKFFTLLKGILPMSQK